MITARVIPFSNPQSLTTAGATPLSIVQVSRDAELSRLRAKVLTTAGHSVISITPEESTAECNVAGPNRVWVFCHTVEFYELALMAVAIRRTKPDDKLLRMIGLEDIGQAPGLFDELLEPIKGVEGLLRAVAALSHP
jgi:hypothetical protein